MLNRYREIIEWRFPDYLVETLDFIERKCELDGGYGEYDYLIGVVIAKDLGLSPYDLGKTWEYESDTLDKAIVTLY